MCISFWAISDQPKKDGYKVIIANNRDELFERPTEEAHFWKDHPHILSGTDNIPGYKGGTWFGISTTGRIALLSNYRQGPSFHFHANKSRGDLVSNFIKSDEKPDEYIEKVKQTGKNYNGFNLIAGKVSKDDSSEFSYYCNQEHEPCEKLKPGVYGLSNRYLDYGWEKVHLGKERFRKIVQLGCPVEEKISLFLELLQDKTRHPDDKQFFDGPCDDGINEYFADLAALTAISVLTLKCNTWYGTRTNTVVIIDADNNVTYVERTMEEPINIEDIHWKINKFEFKIDS